MGTIPDVLSLPSGLQIRHPDKRLESFCTEEYEFYDGIASSDPNAIEPIDILSIFSMNANIEKNQYLRGPTVADKIRNLCRDMNRCCAQGLALIPQNADMLFFDPQFSSFELLIRRATSIRGVGNAVATKILHRKRRNFIPMLDSVIIRHYADPMEKDEIRKAMTSMWRFRDDLRQAQHVIASIQTRMHVLGFVLEPVRILEILIWTERANLYKMG